MQQFDVQAAFLGRPSADAALKATSHASRYINPRAPTMLPDSSQQPLRTHPTVIKCRQLLDSHATEAKHVFGSVKNAARTAIYKVYLQACAALPAVKVNLRKGAMKKCRDEFFDTINTDEIDKQLDLSLIDLDEED